MSTTGRAACQLARRLLSRSAKCPRASVPASLPLESAVEATARVFDRIPRPDPARGCHVSDLLAAGGPSQLHELIHRRHQQLGGMFVETIQGAEVLFVAESGLIRQVFSGDVQCPQYLMPQAWTVYNQRHGCQRGLFFMTGDEWRHHRRIMNKYLLKPSASCHAANFNRIIGSMLTRWEHQLHGRVASTEAELYSFSVEVLAAVLFGERFGMISGRRTLAADTTRLSLLLRRIFVSSAGLSVQDAASAARLQTPEWCDFRSSVSEALHLCRTYVEEKVRHVKQQLASGSKPVGIVAEIISNGEDVTTADLVRIVTDLFLAAGDTTAHSTQWALYRLATTPGLQQRLLDDIKQVAPSKDAPLGAAEIDRIPMVKAIIKETLRMYPVAPFLTRMLQKPTTIGGYEIPAGTPLCISQYSSGRDPRFFPDPLSFRPERWLRHSGCPTQNGTDSSISVHQGENRQHRHACMPFSAGPRGCIGRRIAELQMHLLLVQLVRRYRVEAVNQQPIAFVMRMVGVMSEELQMRITPR